MVFSDCYDTKIEHPETRFDSKMCFFQYSSDNLFLSSLIDNKVFGKLGCPNSISFNVSISFKYQLYLKLLY